MIDVYKRQPYEYWEVRFFSRDHMNPGSPFNRNMPLVGENVADMTSLCKSAGEAYYRSSATSGSQSSYELGKFQV